MLNQFGEQLELAKTEIWVAGCGGHPFLLPGGWLLSAFLSCQC